MAGRGCNDPDPQVSLVWGGDLLREAERKTLDERIAGSTRNGCNSWGSYCLPLCNGHVREITHPSSPTNANRKAIRSGMEGVLSGTHETAGSF